MGRTKVCHSNCDVHVLAAVSGPSLAVNGAAAANPDSGLLRQITSDTEIKVRIIPVACRICFQCSRYSSIGFGSMSGTHHTLILCTLQVTLQVPGWLLISENAISRTGSMVRSKGLLNDPNSDVWTQ